MPKQALRPLAAFLASVIVSIASAAPGYSIVGTQQDRCYDIDGRTIPCPVPGQALAGQDAASGGVAASYVDHGDGTVSDAVTGLMWAKAPIEDVAFADAAAMAKASRLGGHDDWRVPTVRELYSLIDFRGGFTGNPVTSRPYIDTRAFTFAYGAGTGLGDAARGRRPIDVQEWTSTRYVGRTMGRDETVFGVNFADGRIKGYPVMDPANRMQTPHRLALRLVRGPAYGANDFHAHGEMVEDRATGLAWQRGDSGTAVSWAKALEICDRLVLGGYDDWRLPTAKELHSIIDTTRVPALDPVFDLSDTAAYLWTSTTHLESPPAAAETAPFHARGELAIYFAAGPALGKVESPPGSGRRVWMDVHGAGAQRSDPKTATPGVWTEGFGPQGDDIRGANLAKCVRRAH
jgi:hypothetical protein